VRGTVQLVFVSGTDTELKIPEEMDVIPSMKGNLHDKIKKVLQSRDIPK
jgi:hypothetical protein